MRPKSMYIIAFTIIVAFPAIALGQECGWTDRDSKVYVTDIDDNVGIGTTDPGTNKLKVNGNIEATGIKTKVELGAMYTSVYGGYLCHDSMVSSNAVTIAGGVSNIATTYSFIGGGMANAIYSIYSVINGGYENTIDNGQEYDVIGGGKRNRIKYNSDYSVIAGGYQNRMSENSSSDICNYCVIGGGMGNDIYGTSSYSTIAGGEYNNATDNGATVGGGYNNTSGYYSFIGGGTFNEATGSYSTVAGGYDNIASGTCSFAAGWRAIADDNNSFVWSDGREGTSTCPSTDTMQFMVCAINGAYFTDEVSAHSFKDRRGDYPDLDTAYEVVSSMEYISSLGEYIRVVDSGWNNERDLSALVSAQNEVIKDLVSKVEQLENNCNK